MHLQSLPALLLLLVVAPPNRSPGGGSHPRRSSATGVTERVRVNDNRRAAGTLRDGLLRLHLEARLGMWYPDGDSAAGVLVPAFAEEGQAPQIPGPLIRVPAGTEVAVTVRNAVRTAPLTVHGLSSRPGSLALPAEADSIQVAPGAVREVRIRLATPGTYYYWATTMGRGFIGRTHGDAQLSGAIIVDEPGRPVPADRVFVIGLWEDTVGGVVLRSPDTALFVVNGRSWPHTERLAYTVGDTVRWRILNVSADVHPMHLHGFYFRVDSRGDGRSDTVYADARRDLVVTQLMVAGQAMRMTWIPERVGNWLFHCHIPAHFGPRGPIGTRHAASPAAAREHGHVQGMMNGLVVGITVTPRARMAGAGGGAGSDVSTTDEARRRHLRLLVRENQGGTSADPYYGFALHERGPEPPADSGHHAGPPIVLTRGEPVSIMVVNRTSESTSIHWHGIELESYFDGVAGFSGSADRVAPFIVPGDSFEARFTPPRAGTFIYHTHMAELRQQPAGLAGPLIVVEPGARYDPATDLAVLITSPADSSGRAGAVLLNGSLTPAPLRLRQGLPSRLRLINITTGRPGMRMELRKDSAVVMWRVIAKDGAELPVARQAVGPARQRISIGETVDVEVTPAAPGEMRLEARAVGGGLLGVIPVLVDTDLPGAVPLPPAPATPDPLAGLVWRNIGPFRGGRIAAVSGAVGQPGVFYAGLPLGGVWKTTSAGETWDPVFDSVTAVSSVGAIEVAPSDPNVIYVGTGDLITGGGINEGNGVYKSVDAGRTWRHLGLDATRQIPSVLVDPHDANLVLIAAQGDVHAKSEMRGVFRSTDGGKTWSKTLYVNDSTGLQKLAWAADHPEIILATTVRHYTAPPPPPNAGPSAAAAGGGGGGGGGGGPTNTALYKSTDEGLTWHEITGGGLPRLFGRTSVAVAMHTNAQRMFLIGNFGLYRSDDGGVTWRQMDAADKRIANGQGGYNCGVYVDPRNPDIVYTINTSSYKSTDGGNTFTGWKGAPGGDDPQQMWIDPTDGRRILLGVDQGATITLDGGQSWSSWYNQSTAQVYHVAVDNSYPYWVYASQQDAGAIRTRGRGNLGEITPLDWSPVPGWEWGTLVPDPLNPDIVYASGSGIVKITYPSEQWINISPNVDPALRGRTTISQPLAFAPWNQRELLTGFQYLMATTDGGMHWTKLSPDLGYPKGVTPPPDTGPARPPGGPGGGGGAPVGGAIESFSPSTVARGTIWVGTNNGLIKLTRDEGKTWEDVTVPNLPNPTRADISTIDASHHDAAAAYVAIDNHRTGDYRPYFYRTHDDGKTWTAIVNGLPLDQPSGSFARVIRADTKRAGLLFAGTESGMYVSFDDGDHWQSLMLNLPNTSYRDMVIHGNDLVVGTYGRGIYVLDDVSPLRQLTPAVATEPAHLFAPGDAIRVRRNVNFDTPFPPEAPHAFNPPDGAIIYYFLGSKPAGEVTLDVLDAAGNVVRHLSSAPIPPLAEAAQPPEPNFWLATPQPMPVAVGTNRVNWDLRYDSPSAFTHTYEINANPGLTPASPEGPLALPGVYTLKLMVGGKSYTQTVTVLNDPRSPATAADLRAQHELQMKLYNGMQQTWVGGHQVAAMRAAVAVHTAPTAPAEVAAAARAFDSTLAAVAGSTEGGRGFGRGGAPAPATFVGTNDALVRQLTTLENGDLAPTEAMQRAYEAGCAELKTLVTTWGSINSTALAAFNAVLARHNLTSIAGASSALAVPACPPARR